jgi:hypothetical protein
VYAADLTIRLRPRASLDARYLAHYLNYVWSTGHWKERASGASWTMKKISRRQLAPLPIPWPAAEVQGEIVRVLEEELGTVEAIYGCLCRQAAALERIPAALLRSAFSDSSPTTLTEEAPCPLN